MRNSHQFSYVSKLVGEVLVGSGIQISAQFTPQWIQLQRESVKSSILPITGPGKICPSMLHPVAKIGSQHLVLRAGQTATPARVTSSGRNRSSRGALLQMPLCASPPLPRFPPYAPTIYVWPFKTPQKNIAVTPPPHGCTLMGLLPPLLNHLGPPVLAQTIISMF